jgi:hypothetical protein
MMAGEQEKSVAKLFNLCYVTWEPSEMESSNNGVGGGFIQLKLD